MEVVYETAEGQQVPSEELERELSKARARRQQRCGERVDHVGISIHGV